MKIGIDIGGSHIAIGVVNEQGKIVEKIEKRLTQIEKSNIENSIEESIEKYVQEFCQNYEIDEVGIGIPGEIKDDIIVRAYNLGMKNYPIIQKLKEKINLPINVQNDATCAAIAEKKYGCLKGEGTSLFFTLGTGIGGSLFYDDELVDVRHFGHMVIVKNGIPCNCGRKGCFERYASMKAFKNSMRNALNLDDSTRGEQLFEMIRDNKPENKNYEVIEQVVEDYIESLSVGLLNFVYLFHPNVIGIGGSFVHFAEVLLPRLKNRISQEWKENLVIKTAILGNDAGIIGAVSK